jgi:hypothetical protein
MSKSKSDVVTTQVVEIEPGWILIRCCDPKPELKLIESFLRKTIEDWFAERPTLLMDTCVPVVYCGELVGMNVWYHVAEQDQASHENRQSTREKLTVDIPDAILQRFSKEYVEACVADAVDLLPRFAERSDTFVAVSPRGVAVQVDPPNRRMCVVSAETVLGIVTGPSHERLQAWYLKPDSSCYVLHVSGVWFLNGPHFQN